MQREQVCLSQNSFREVRTIGPAISGSCDHRESFEGAQDHLALREAFGAPSFAVEQG